MERQNSRQTPFELSPSFSDPIRRALFALVKRPIETLLGLPEFGRLYQQAFGDGKPRDFLQTALTTLAIHYEVSPEHLQHIPKEGAVVIVANHPYGGFEGLVLAALVKSVRPDSKQLSNYMLSRIPQWRDHAIFVDPFGRAQSARFNTAPIRQAITWLKGGGALEVFPAGEVSHLDLKHRTISDRQWQVTVARLIRRAQAPVVPVFFEGHNGMAFQLAGLIHPRLRTVMLPRTLLKLRGKTLRVRIGEVTPFSRLDSFLNDADLLSYLRARTYILKDT